MPHPALAELLSYAKEREGPTANRLANFVAAYFDNTDPDEIRARGALTLFAIANAHWRLLEAPRTPSGVKVRVFNATLAEDGFVSEHTSIQIVHDDMPFLVDSVTMAINRSGRTAHWIVHPLFAVQRDPQGQLLKTSHAKPHDLHSDAIESLILVECDRMVGQEERRALAADLSKVLADVRAVVQDWRPMLDRLH
ncbi:MAG: NAD-glutamate dehydrogenase, partial [Betaproteobacteria bacterium]